MELSKEQQIAFDKYKEGHNIFITGPGGTGKSEIIRLIYKHAISSYKEIYVTALTGCAAILLNCKAKTLHSWAGIGLGLGTPEEILNKLKKKPLSKAIWQSTDILVIDEVSMLSLKLFETLNLIGKKLRKNEKPFGGMQLIFSGDFYQLPPVGDYLEPDTQKFCFESELWNDVFHLECQIELKKIFRQSDELYLSILNQIREGKIKRKINDILLEYVGKKVDNNFITEPTKLYPTKNKVNQTNFMKLDELKSEEKTFTIEYLYDIEMTKKDKDIRKGFSDKDIEIELDFLSGNLLCEKSLTLKIGCQVMCIININTTEGDLLICNGSQGIVIDFKNGFPYVHFNNGHKMVMLKHIWQSDKIPGIGVTQVPLILSWALTIHKSQGSTLESAEIDVGSGIFECGQTYVALSRVKSLNGLYLTSFDVSKIKINKKVKGFYELLRLYHETKQQTTEKNDIYVPLVIAEEVPLAIAEEINRTNRFIQYEYIPNVIIENKEIINLTNNI